MSEYTDAVARGLEGMTGVSTGACPGCPQCMEHDGHTDEEEHRLAVSEGRECSDSHFSWRPCGICGTRLGGDRERWHWVSVDAEGKRTIEHEDDACTDCVLYLAHGTEPENWRKHISSAYEKR